MTVPLRKLLVAFVLLLLPVGWLSMKYERYQVDGDAVSYMDISDLIRAHDWAGVVNGYWHPLYPAGLAVADAALHVTRANELRAAYVWNYTIFLASVAAMLAFISGLEKLRRRSGGDVPLLSADALRLLGLGLLVLAAERELSMGKVRPDALLQALMLAAFAMLLQSLATESLVFAPLMGLFLGLAYLTKSFAFLVALLSIAVMVVVQGWFQRRKLGRVVAGGLLALVVFGAVAGPYVAALSKQKGRFDFGDSGALNYAWFVSGTEKFHLEPWQTGRFGSAKVELVHPEAQLLAVPGVYSYRGETRGSYPPWFDPTYFHERIVPVFSAKLLLRHDVRNAVLCLRYFLNHPEALLLLALLWLMGARVAWGDWRRGTTLLPVVMLGLAMWAIYGMVNIEDRYVTLAYLLVLLPVFAALKVRVADPQRGLSFAAAGLVSLLAFLALGNMLRVSLEERRDESAEGLPSAWYSPTVHGAAAALQELGVRPGDEVACMGTMACVYDQYWMRLAGVRTMTEIDNPDAGHLLEELESLPNRIQVYDLLRAQGAKVLVASFDPGKMTAKTPATEGWVRLGASNLYALPLLLARPVEEKPAQIPWDTTLQEAP